MSSSASSSASSPLLSPAPPAPPAPYSLRARLLGFLLVPLIALLGLSIVTDYRDGLRIANDAYDQALHGMTLALSAIIEHELAENSPDLTTQIEAVLRVNTVDQVYYVAVDGEGRFLAGDEQVLSLFPEYGADDEEDNPDYRFDTFNQQEVRVAIWRRAPDERSQGMIIVVAETMHKREAAASRIMTITLFSNLFFICISLLVIFIGLRYAHRPLVLIGQQIQAREPDDMMPLNESAAPREIHALIRAINHLMANLREAGIAQQNFISDTAHQLRSPLTALQAQIDVAIEHASDGRHAGKHANPAESDDGKAEKECGEGCGELCAAARAETLRRLKSMQVAVNRLSRLTRQMLALARAAPNANRNIKPDSVALDELIENAASEFIDQALLAEVDLGFELLPAVTPGVAWSLREMLANLVDNAVRYTGAGGKVVARCGTEADGSVWLEVEDNGPGIPEELREKVFERFMRLSDIPGGSGLGLAIVMESALSHHARVNLYSGAEGQGLRVRVTFPAVSSSAQGKGQFQ